MLFYSSKADRREKTGKKVPLKSENHVSVEEFQTIATPLSLLITWWPNMPGMSCARTKTSKALTRVRLVFSPYTVIEVNMSSNGFKTMNKVSY